jgi:hypothetical protein
MGPTYEGDNLPTQRPILISKFLTVLQVNSKLRQLIAKAKMLWLALCLLKMA